MQGDGPMVLPSAAVSSCQSPRDCCAHHHVVSLQIGHLFEYLLEYEPGGEEIEDIRDPDSHAPDAGTPAALPGIHRDSFLFGADGGSLLLEVTSGGRREAAGSTDHRHIRAGLLEGGDGGGGWIGSW